MPFWMYLILGVIAILGLLGLYIFKQFKKLCKLQDTHLEKATLKLKQELVSAKNQVAILEDYINKSILDDFGFQMRVKNHFLLGLHLGLAIIQSEIKRNDYTVHCFGSSVQGMIETLEAIRMANLDVYQQQAVNKYCEHVRSVGTQLGIISCCVKNNQFFAYAQGGKLIDDEKEPFCNKIVDRNWDGLIKELQPFFESLDKEKQKID